MTDIPRCQSCGCPLYRDVLGTKSDGSPSREYCKDCYQKGVYTEPGATLSTMVDREMKRLIAQKIVTDEIARESAHHLISRLRRWTSKS